MEPGLGARFAGFCRSLFPDGWSCKFWIVHDVWFAVAKNVERHHRSVFSILAGKLWLVDSFGPGAPGPGRLAYLESRVALGGQTSSGCSLCLTRGCDLRVGYFFKTAPWEWDNLKLMVWGYFLILPFLWSDII